MDSLFKEIVRHLPRGAESRRLFHGRGGAFPEFTDVVIDYYQPLIHIMLHRRREQQWLQALTQYLRDVVPDARGIYVQERFKDGAPGRLLWGEVPEETTALENGLRYYLRLGEALNNGFFPDMAAGRSLVRDRAGGKKVLNLFSYTCSFSVAALAGEAQQVINLDMNRGALALGRKNHELNSLDLRRVSFLCLEFFRSLGRIRKLGPFDMIICDPPAAQGRSFTAEKHWPKLIRHLPSLLSKGGEVLACLNAPHLTGTFLDELFGEIWPEAKLLSHCDPGEDFPFQDEERATSLHHFGLT